MVITLLIKLTRHTLKKEERKGGEFFSFSCSGRAELRENDEEPSPRQFVCLREHFLVLFYGCLLTVSLRKVEGGVGILCEKNIPAEFHRCGILVAGLSSQCEHTHFLCYSCANFHRITKIWCFRSTHFAIKNQLAKQQPIQIHTGWYRNFLSSFSHTRWWCERAVSLPWKSNLPPLGNVCEKK